MRLTEVTSELDNGTYIEPCQMTMEQWLDVWLAEYTTDIKPLTLVSYKTHVKNNNRPYLGQIKLSGLDAPTIQKLQNGLAEIAMDGRQELGNIVVCQWVNCEFFNRGGLRYWRDLPESCQAAQPAVKTCAGRRAGL